MVLAVGGVCVWFDDELFCGADELPEDEPADDFESNLNVPLVAMPTPPTANSTIRTIARTRIKLEEPCFGGGAP